MYLSDDRTFKLAFLGNGENVENATKYNSAFNSVTRIRAFLDSDMLRPHSD